MVTKPSRTEAPPQGSEEWKAFVADAVGRPPARRTEAERKAVEAAMAAPSDDDDRKLVVAYMHPTGEHAASVDAESYEAVFVLGDGFGAGLTWEDLGRINGGADWSHVRDSSPDAWAAMARELRDRGYAEAGPGTRPGA